MSDPLKSFNQREYSRILNEHNGCKLSYSQCINYLMEHGASYNQAKNGAYTYLYHGNHLEVQQRGRQDLYNHLLDKFNGITKSNMECIRYLESLGFSQGQAKNAAYNYRKSKGLIK
ncbi:MAG TPA: hypothetical protein ENH35_03155 [Candidatus Moranbacteria bacterium]|nr:hypothetical protein BMS3Bbin08_01300 [bacterium BMS3Bbin08]HDZ85517.1 hypothetical protein [Candidatus Moranbacteria bacterium]